MRLDVGMKELIGSVFDEVLLKHINSSSHTMTLKILYRTCLFGSWV